MDGDRGFQIGPMDAGDAFLFCGSELSFFSQGALGTQRLEEIISRMSLWALAFIEESAFCFNFICMLTLP